MSEPYEILPHTADLRIRATGKTIEELFRNSLRGMSSVMQSEAGGQRSDVERKVVVASPDTPSLLIDFLAEALASAQVNREVYSDVEFAEFDDRHVRATLRGVPVESFEKDVKAVTYHGIEIKETDNGYEATIIYDI